MTGNPILPQILEHYKSFLKTCAYLQWTECFVMFLTLMDVCKVFSGKIVKIWSFVSSWSDWKSNFATDSGNFQMKIVFKTCVYLQWTECFVKFSTSIDVCKVFSGENRENLEFSSHL